jgi:cobalamin biosynthesis protein CobD/CbiB
MNADARRRLADRIDWWGKRLCAIMFAGFAFALGLNLIRGAIRMCREEPITLLWAALGLIAVVAWFYLMIRFDDWLMRNRTPRP